MNENVLLIECESYEMKRELKRALKGHYYPIIVLELVYTMIFYSIVLYYSIVPCRVYDIIPSCGGDYEINVIDKNNNIYTWFSDSEPDYTIDENITCIFGGLKDENIENDYILNVID